MKLIQTTFGILCTVIFAAGCNRHSNSTAPSNQEINTPPRAEQMPTNRLTPTGRDTNSRVYPADTNQSSAQKPDNTGVNARDRSDGGLTATDQGASDSDREISRSVRNAIMGRDDLSTTAKNIKIITREGKVTLRGPVNSEVEQKAMAEIAQGISGVTSVDNQLEVKTNQ